MRVLVLSDIHLKPFMFSRAKEILNEGVADISVVLKNMECRVKKIKNCLENI